MTAEPTEPTETPADDIVRIETDQQLHAIGSLTRHRVLRVLRDGPATVTQIAARLGIAKGSSNYHVKVLAKAGLIRIVDTRKVRGVTELYYGMGGGFQLPQSGSGQPDILMRHALADVEAAPEAAERHLRLQHLRLSPENFDLAAEKVAALHAELTALHDPEQPAADFFSAVYRPLDTKPLDAKAHDAEPLDTEPQSARTPENGAPAS